MLAGKGKREREWNWVCVSVFILRPHENVKAVEDKFCISKQVRFSETEWSRAIVTIQNSTPLLLIPCTLWTMMSFCPFQEMTLIPPGESGA